MKNTFKFLMLTGVAITLSACSGVLPVPGGKSTINDGFYKSNTELKAKLNDLRPGMTKQIVFSKLGRSQDELKRLDREGVINALYGGQYSPYALGSAHNPYGEIAINSLSGYQLNYRIVKRKHGLKSPVSIRTDENGFDYSATLIFKDDILFEPPIISGGLIDNSSSKTLFDYLNPSMVINRL